MKYVEGEKWELPPRLRMDSAEKLAAADAAQRELARKVQSPFASVSPSERERERAARLVAEHKATAELLGGYILVTQRREDLSGGERRQLAAAREALPVILTQLAEAYAATGRYDKAAEYEPDEGKRDEYLRIWEAVWKNDGEWCDCPPATSDHSQRRGLRHDERRGHAETRRGGARGEGAGPLARL